MIYLLIPVGDSRLGNWQQMVSVENGKKIGAKLLELSEF
jgi:hypothetical protein